MKRIIISIFVAMSAIVIVQAQQIAVVTGSTTKICQTLKDAIEAASDGSTIYLPGGGFQISDDTKITKQLTIIGIGHKANSENVDGNTVISGNLFFNEGSSGSSVMGCYISGTINIGDDGKAVNNIVVRYCNLNNFVVKSKLCTGTIINQNYIRKSSNGNYAAVEVTNNIMGKLYNVSGGIIRNNLFPSRGAQYSLEDITSSTVAENMLYYGVKSCNNNVGYRNLHNTTYDGSLDGSSYVSKENWSKFFFKDAGINPESDFHLTDDYKEYSDIGIYGGTGFSDSGMAPVPFIMAKDIPAQTDGEGKLNIKIRVKASE